MKFNRTTRRLLERLQKADRPQVIDITESVHILAQAGLVEYEAYTYWPNVVLAWATTRNDALDAKPEGALVVRKESADDRVKAEAEEYLRGVTESINREQNAPKDMLVVICQFEQEVDQKDMEILTLRAELNRVHDEYTWLASRKLKPTKELTMAKFDLDMQNVEVGGVKLGSIIVHIDVPDTAFDVLATVYKEALPIIFGQIKRDVECRCAAHNGDKHPGTAM